jgi:hypothetical protein
MPNNFDDVFNKEKELLDLSYKQSKANKQERLDNEKKRSKTDREESISSFFESCLSPEERKKRKKKMYEVWYIPRIQDELVVARFDNIDDAYDHMDKIRIVRPKAHPYHYIWDLEKEIKIEERGL